MKTTRHGEHLVRLTRLGMVNCYLVREPDGFTLVDTSLPNSAAAILNAARNLDAPIVRIVLTHAHVDHAASLDALRKALPQAEVAVGSREARLLAGDFSLEAGEPQVKLRGSYQTCQTQPDRLLEPGDRVGSLEVIAAAGHTPGHIAFLDVRDKTVIAGDALQTWGGVAVAGVMRWLFPLPALATWHKPTALRSAQALRSLNPTRVAVGHGRVLDDPLPALDRAIQTAARQIGPG